MCLILLCPQVYEKPNELRLYNRVIVFSHTLVHTRIVIYHSFARVYFSGLFHYPPPSIPANTFFFCLLQKINSNVCRHTAFCTYDTFLHNFVPLFFSLSKINIKSRLRMKRTLLKTFSFLRSISF